MKYAKKLLVFFIVSILATSYLLLATPRAFAANENFSTTAQVTYTINSSGLTHVQFTETLTNTTDTYYASVYKIHLGFQDIQNISASDTMGPIKPSVDKAGDGEDLSLPFTSRVFGKGKSLPFSFSFDTKEVASLKGSIWEVNIPGLSSASDFAAFTVHVIVPSYFGTPTYIKPAITNTTLTFTKDDLGKSGISLAFGDTQVYSFHLIYTIKNDQLFATHTQIALPPNTSYQHVEIDTMSPHPQNVILDTDGNWLAQYQLAPSQKLKITVTGKAYIALRPSKEILTVKQQSLYTQQDTYWESTNPQIKSLAASLKTPEAIFQYVVNTLHYNFARITDTQERLGAARVLLHPDEAVCLEFTDLFIALSRAAGIPARELDGYGYTQNTTQRPLSLQKEILHAWPEYYDTAQQAWVMVDPTWENTTGGVDYFHTFDFDHITLVIKGTQSTYPVPAGGYKLTGQEAEKDVQIAFAPPVTEPQPAATATLDSMPEFTAGLPLSARLIIKNTGTVLFPSEALLVTSTLQSRQETVVGAIPPFGYASVPITFGQTPILTNTHDTITIHFAGKTIAKSIHITAFSTPVLFSIGGVFIVLCSFIISKIARRSRGVSISQRKK